MALDATAKLRHVRDAMPPIVRFAPSPTGLLHLGNARTAVVNWLFARQQAVRLVLRLDDTDRQRSSTDFERAIREDLTLPWGACRPTSTAWRSRKAPVRPPWVVLDFLEHMRYQLSPQISLGQLLL